MSESGPFEMPHWDVCPFCENVAGRNQCAVIEDRSATLAFINPRQFTNGAALVIPHRHTPTVLDLNEDDAAHVMQCVVRVARAITQAFNPVGMNIFQNNGRFGYQSVPHFHIHVLPRYEDDGWSPIISSASIPKTPIETRMKLAEQIRRHL